MLDDFVDEFAGEVFGSGVNGSEAVFELVIRLGRVRVIIFIGNNVPFGVHHLEVAGVAFGFSLYLEDNPGVDFADEVSAVEPGEVEATCVVDEGCFEAGFATPADYADGSYFSSCGDEVVGCELGYGAACVFDFVAGGPVPEEVADGLYTEFPEAEGAFRADLFEVLYGGIEGDFDGWWLFRRWRGRW